MDWIIASAAYAFNPHKTEMQNSQSVTIKNIEAGIRAMQSGPAGELNGFALGGSETGNRAELAKQVAAEQVKDCFSTAPTATHQSASHCGWSVDGCRRARLRSHTERCKYR